jgi:hypothetical protein
MQEHTENRQRESETDAEIRLAESLHRLHTLRLHILSGRGYDPDEFDEAVMEFRRAWEAARARRRGDRGQSDPKRGGHRRVA